MILNKRIKGVSKPTRAKDGWAFKHRDLLTSTGRALTASGIPLNLAADLLGVSNPILCIWIGKAIRAEQKKKGDA